MCVWGEQHNPSVIFFSISHRRVPPASAPQANAAAAFRRAVLQIDGGSPPVKQRERSKQTKAADAKSLQRFITGLSRPRGGPAGEEHPPPGTHPTPVPAPPPSGDLSAAYPIIFPQLPCFPLPRLPSKGSP